MPEDERRRKKLPPFWEDELFQSQFEAVKRMIEELMEKLDSTSSQDLFESDAVDLEGLLRELQGNPMIWGFSVTADPDGRIRLNPFGNLSTEGSAPSVKNEREPLIEVMDQNGVFIIVAELPGVQKEDIQLTITETQVTIRVDTPKRKYFKVIDLSVPCKREVARFTYANGILEVHLQKR
ncbi:MAG: Hsp20/alpha crystallin family protein [Promethearchaeota archaeon]